jgi:hypothetical protein
MTLIGLLVAIAIVGVLLWAINQFPFIDAGVKKVLYIVIVVALVLWLITSLSGHGLNARLW